MKAPAQPLWREALRKRIAAGSGSVHLMGIGGIGMAGVARLLAGRGLRVSGCDETDSRVLQRLKAEGFAVVQGHDVSHLDGVDWCVFSPALAPDHPERLAAEDRGIPLYRRGQVLPVLAEQWKTIAVSGTHGKTTTSAMLAHLLRACGQDASWCIGGELPPDGASAGIGTSDWLVIEADESDATLAHYAPEITVITNIEFDHMEHFDSPGDMEDCFRSVTRQTRGPVLVSADDPVALRLGEETDAVTFGFSEQAAYRAEILETLPDGTCFSLHLPDGTRCEAIVPLPGRHNVQNAAGALAACVLCGVDVFAAGEALASFRPPRRRYELIANAGGIRILGDYAHHPSEVRALVDAVRQAGAGRILAVFQPHRYTRTLALGPEFPPAFDGVDELILAPVYAASEPPLPGGSSEDLLSHFQRHAGVPVELAGDLTDAADRVFARWQPGDWILLIGAGDVESLGPVLKQRLG